MMYGRLVQMKDVVRDKDGADDRGCCGLVRTVDSSKGMYCSVDVT